MRLRWLAGRPGPLRTRAGLARGRPPGRRAGGRRGAGRRTRCRPSSAPARTPIAHACLDPDCFTRPSARRSCTRPSRPEHRFELWGQLRWRPTQPAGDRRYEYVALRRPQDRPQPTGVPSLRRRGVHAAAHRRAGRAPPLAGQPAHPPEVPALRGPPLALRRRPLPAAAHDDPLRRPGGRRRQLAPQRHPHEDGRPPGQTRGRTRTARRRT